MDSTKSNLSFLNLKGFDSLKSYLPFLNLFPKIWTFLFNLKMSKEVGLSATKTQILKHKSANLKKEFQCSTNQKSRNFVAKNCLFLFTFLPLLVFGLCLFLSFLFSFYSFCFLQFWPLRELKKAFNFNCLV